jgi:hypothetical protein
MINATVVFWVMIGIFGFVGLMRAWQKEVIATASIVLALFALSQLNSVARLTSVVPDAKLDGLDQVRQQQAVDAVKVNRFAVQAIPFLVITFFGYMGPTITRQFQPGKFQDKARVGVQEGVVGFLIGGINGWLVISTLARFAFNMGILPDQGQFPTVGQALFIPPGGGGWAKFFFIESSAIAILAGPTLVIALVVLFLFVIIAFI